MWIILSKNLRKKRVMDLSNLKTIDVSELYEDINIFLNVDIKKIYSCFCCEILVYCKNKHIRLFVSETDYHYRILNTDKYLNIYTKTVSDEFYIHNDILTKTILLDIYDMQYKKDFKLKLPNDKIINFLCRSL